VARDRTRSFVAVAIAYVTAIAVAALVVDLIDAPTWLTLLAADVAGTVVVFAFSVAHDNSSVYDPYWSVAPIVIVVWLAAHGDGNLRELALAALVLAWGARLTWNWARGWRGLDHEDWRYVAIRGKTGRAYWLVSFVGVHLMPTLWVYLGSLSLVPAIASRTPLGLLDAAALAVTLGSLALETVADQQLRAFRLAGPHDGEILMRGVWRWSRHPNYLGEIGFWWGLYLFALAADPGAWWLVVGPAAITLLFVTISVPLLDRRSLERRPAYAEHMIRVPALVPRPWRRY
jgi:steroid 5-alpha reductase family enzyme